MQPRYHLTHQVRRLQSPHLIVHVGIRCEHAEIGEAFHRVGGGFALGIVLDKYGGRTGIDRGRDEQIPYRYTEACGQ